MAGEMAGYSPAYPFSWNKVQVQRVSADAVVCPGSGFLLGATLFASGGNSTVDLYDGQNAVGKLLLPMAVLQNDSRDFECVWPRRFDRGLFVDIGSNVGKFVVVFVPETETLRE